MPTLVKQWVEQGRIEGLEQGREEGREAALMVLRRFLNHRFGTTLDRFDPDFEPLDLAAITKLSDAAFEVNTLTEFEAILTKLKVEQQVESGDKAEE